MDFLKFWLTLLGLITFVHAGVYHCEDINGQPEEKLQVPSKFIPHTAEPFFVPKAFNRAAALRQRPFLVYYAIDPDEPFMRYAVDFEVARLKESCEASADVEFAVIRNSQYVSMNEITICKNQIVSTINLSSYSSFDLLLKKKRKIILEEDNTLEEKNPLIEFPVSFEKSVNSSFARFPLAHPDFLHDFLKLLITEKSLFPSEEYIPFLNLKSHGNREYVLSGLHPCQVLAKNKAQNKLMNETLTPSQRNALAQSSASPEQAGALDKLFLGSKIGKGTYLERLNDIGLNDIGLNEIGLGPIGGLSDGQGLGAEFAFGTFHLAVNAVLRTLFNEDNGKVLGFVMFESCDTNRDPVFNHTVLENTLGFYSAKHTLWYRNLNWWTLLESANGSAENLLKNLDEETRLIPNLEIIE